MSNVAFNRTADKRKKYFVGTYSKRKWPIFSRHIKTKLTTMQTTFIKLSWYNIGASMKFVLAVLYTIVLVSGFAVAYPGPVEDQVQNPSVENVRAQRHVGNGQFPYGYDDHVDFGAHTGDHGAFGWYADFPVQ